MIACVVATNSPKKIHDTTPCSRAYRQLKGGTASTLTRQYADQITVQPLWRVLFTCRSSQPTRRPQFRRRSIRTEQRRLQPTGAIPVPRACACLINRLLKAPTDWGRESLENAGD